MRVIKLAFLLVIALSSGFEARADWLCAHGNSAVFQDREKEPDSGSRFGWGLDFAYKNANIGHYTWLHYSIPTNGPKRVSRVLISFMNQNLSSIHAVHVWSGGTRVAAYDAGPRGSSYRVEERSVDFSSSSPLVSGAGISLQLWSDASVRDTGLPRIVIARVCIGP